MATKTSPSEQAAPSPTPTQPTYTYENEGLLRALAALRAELTPVKADSKNPAFHSKYASLAAVHEVLNPLLTKYELIPTYSVYSMFHNDSDPEKQEVVVELVISHIPTGASINGRLGLIPVKQDPQGIGSAITYARRYLLTTMFDLTTDDDDGNMASKTPRQTQHNGKQEIAPVPPQLTPAEAARKELVGKIHGAGLKLTQGDRAEWDKQRAAYIEHVTDGESTSLTSLTDEGLEEMLAELEAAIAKREQKATGTAKFN